MCNHVTAVLFTSEAVKNKTPYQQLSCTVHQSHASGISHCKKKILLPWPLEIWFLKSCNMEKVICLSNITSTINVDLAFPLT